VLAPESSRKELRFNQTGLGFQNDRVGLILVHLIAVGGVTDIGCMNRDRPRASANQHHADLSPVPAIFIAPHYPALKIRGDQIPWIDLLFGPHPIADCLGDTIEPGDG
jgi:hypothetical protein